MGYIKNGEIEALTKRLVAAIDYLAKGGRPKYGPDDLGVLTYVRSQLRPNALKRRGEEDTNLSKIMSAASERLPSYESEAA